MIERNSRLFARHAVTSVISLYQHIRVCLVQLELSGTIRFLKTPLVGGTDTGNTS